MAEAKAWKQMRYRNPMEWSCAGWVYPGCTVRAWIVYGPKWILKECRPQFIPSEELHNLLSRKLIGTGSFSQAIEKHNQWPWNQSTNQKGREGCRHTKVCNHYWIWNYWQGSSYKPTAAEPSLKPQPKDIYGHAHSSLITLYQGPCIKIPFKIITGLIKCTVKST